MISSMSCQYILSRLKNGEEEHRETEKPLSSSSKPRRQKNTELRSFQYMPGESMMALIKRQTLNIPLVSNQNRNNAASNDNLIVLAEKRLTLVLCALVMRCT